MEKKNREEEYQNEFEKDIQDLKEWQDNQYNPGHYIGTGKVPRPMKKLTSFPTLMIAIGVTTLLPVLLILFGSDPISSKLSAMICPLIISIVFLYGGISRKLQQKKGKL